MLVVSIQIHPISSELRVLCFWWNLNINAEKKQVTSPCRDKDMSCSSKSGPWPGSYKSVPLTLGSLLHSYFITSIYIHIHMYYISIIVLNARFFLSLRACPTWGLNSLVVAYMKKIIQEYFKLQLQWDDKLPDCILPKWQQFKQIKIIYRVM